MAYTYQDFENAARNANLYNQFSAYDLQLAQANPDVGMGLLSAKAAWNSATDDAGRAAANQQAESLRSNAYNTAGITSYTGGTWGNEYNPIQNGNPTGSMVPQTSTNTGATGTSFTQATAKNNASGSQWDASNLTSFPTFTPTPTPELDLSGYSYTPYSSPYTPQIEAAAGQLGNYPSFSYEPFTSRYDAEIQAAKDEAFNREKFNYDYATDPVYQAYAKQYRREGDRAMQNAIAQNAARTGGLTSSAAMAAAQQANNYYNAQLSDKIPALYADAYNRYLQDYSMSMDKLNSLMRLDDTDWNRYDSTRKFDFDIYQDGYNQLYNYFNALLAQDKNAFSQSEAGRDQYNKDVDRAIQIWRDQVGDQQWVDEMVYKAAADAYNAQYNQYNLGYEQELDTINRAIDQEREEWERDYKNRQLEAMYSGKSGSNSSSNSSSNKNPQPTPEPEPAPEPTPEPEPETVDQPKPGDTQTPNINVYFPGNQNALWGVVSAEELAYMIKQKEIEERNGKYYYTSGEEQKKSNPVTIPKNKKSSTPVYLSTSGDKVWQELSENDLQLMKDDGMIEFVKGKDGNYRYVYIG